MASTMWTDALKTLQPTNGGSLSRAGEPGMGSGNVPFAPGIFKNPGASAGQSGPSSATGAAGYGGLTPPSAGPSPSQTGSTGGAPSTGGQMMGDPAALMAGQAFIQDLFNVLMNQAIEADRARKSGIL